MLIKVDTLKRIKRGEVRLVFRRWRRPTVKAGGSLKTVVGVLGIEAVERINVRSISTAAPITGLRSKPKSATSVRFGGASRTFQVVIS